ncbi:hypothetical protein OG723_44615 (plasmid) [Streptomyces sp. NBC_01278]|uniref:hypothetical protein n=1 Tax=Streptomyces sp. NBC_01278 TaxID=2903809 RepID=UPI002E2EAF8B|nr:hypothetical protein [Streptomyces sp. NBC_01278]
MAASDDRCSVGSEDAVIRLLMEEYKSLRAEVTQRVAERTQLIVVAGGVAAILTAVGGLSFRTPHLYVAIAIVLFAVVWGLIGSRDMMLLGAHLVRLENRINLLAERAYGAPAVLTWERWISLEQGRRMSRLPWTPWRRRLRRRSTFDET